MSLNFITSYLKNNSPLSTILKPLSSDRLEMMAVSAHEISDHLPEILIKAERIAGLLQRGPLGRRRSGIGHDFWDYRLYSSGDHLRMIDWQKSARSDEFFIKKTEWELSQNLWLDGDLSPSMMVRSSDAIPTKCESMWLIMFILTFLSLRAGERVGLLNHPSERRFKRDISDMPHMITELMNDDGGDQNFSAAKSKRSGIKIIGSDFCDSIDKIKQKLEEVSSSKQKGIMLWILDPMEAILPEKGRVRLVEPETSEAIVLTLSAKIAKAYQAEMQEKEQQLYRVAKNMGWGMIKHVTNQSPFDAIMRVTQYIRQNIRHSNMLN